MRRSIGYFCLMMALGAGTAAGQAKQVDYANVYCAGVYSTESVPHDRYVISGEEARQQITFQQGQYIYINGGSSTQVGEEFAITRPVKSGPPSWFRWKWSLERAMGRHWKDLGRVRVVSIQNDVAIAQVVYSCDYIQRGDYVRPWREHPRPVLRSGGDFDRFAPASGREIAQVVSGKDEASQVGAGDIMYVNMGSGQGVNVGDYVRVFRYQGTRNEMPYDSWHYQDRMSGFGKAGRMYNWKELPREAVGEGVVVRTGPTSSTVLLTRTIRAAYLGDFVELMNPAPVIAEAPAPAPAPAANRPPTMSCSVDRDTVIAGERVRVSARASDPDGDALTYAWRSNGGEIVGSGASVMLDTTGLRPGRYSVTGQVADGRSAAADCAVAVNVQPPPAAAQAMKVNECVFRASSAGVDNVCKRILDDVSTRLKGDPRSRLVIVGYADPAESGSARLAGQRAENAKQYLLSTGVADARVDVRAASGQEGAGRQNRRVDFVWVPAGASY